MYVMYLLYLWVVNSSDVCVKRNTGGCVLPFSERALCPRCGSPLSHQCVVSLSKTLPISENRIVREGLKRGLCRYLWITVVARQGR